MWKSTADTLLSIYDKVASDQVLQYRVSDSSKFKTCQVVKMLTFLHSNSAFLQYDVYGHAPGQEHLTRGL